MLRKIIFAVILTLSAGASSANAAILIDTFDIDDGYAIDQAYSVYLDNKASMKFTTGSEYFRVTDVGLALSQVNELFVGENSSVDVTIHESAGNSPGSALAASSITATLPLWIVESAPPFFAYFDDGLVLLPNTTYWLTVDGTTPAGTPGFFSAWNMNSIGERGTRAWMYSGSNGNWITYNDNTLAAFRISGEAVSSSVVPEPTSMALLGMGAIGLIGRRRLRRGAGRVRSNTTV